MSQRTKPSLGHTFTDSFRRCRCALRADPAAGHARAALCAFNAGERTRPTLRHFDQDGFAIRAGQHCTQPLHDVLGAAGSARASLYIYNTHEEVDAFVDALGSTLLLPHDKVPASGSSTNQV